MDISLIIQQKNDHNHDPDDRGNERHVLRVNAKRKAVDDLSARPSKVIKRPASVRTLAFHPFAEHLQERSPDLVSTSNLYRKPSHKIDLCPLFVSITVT
jgi:hypothetical protein